MRLSAGELAYIEKFNRLYPLKFEVTTEITGKESEKSLKNEVRQIMLDKLKEMSKIKLCDHLEINAYASLCSAMNDIAKTLLDK